MKRSGKRLLIILSLVALLGVSILFVRAVIASGRKKVEASVTGGAARMYAEVIALYLRSEHRWPGSWQDLEQIQPANQGWSGLRWPGSLAEARKYVDVDFSIDPCRDGIECFSIDDVLIVHEPELRPMARNHFERFLGDKLRKHCGCAAEPEAPQKGPRDAKRTDWL